MIEALLIKHGRTRAAGKEYPLYAVELAARAGCRKGAGRPLKEFISEMKDAFGLAEECEYRLTVRFQEGIWMIAQKRKKLGSRRQVRNVFPAAERTAA